jgi:hypothetical protein
LSEFFAMMELAEAYGRRGEFERGLSLLNGMAQVIDAIPALVEEATLYRVRGELLFAQALETIATTGSSSTASATEQLEVAEAAFMRSVEVSRKQQARSLELRATHGLCRLWQHQGKVAEARAALAEIYWWFTEGFDTADLLNARALLEELIAASSDAK